MVYCGKPSKGCQTCRTRKIRCDQKPDGCSQCAKVQKECPGYRVQLDLMFRNESTSVVKKAKAKEALKKVKPPPETPRPVTSQALTTYTPGEVEEIDNVFLDEAKQRDWTFPRYNKGPPSHAIRPSPSAGPSIMPSLVDAASAFFIQNFVIGLAPPNGASAAESSSLIPPAYEDGNLDPHLIASMRAVGFASFSNIVGAPEIMKHARHNYMVALKATNAALRSPTEAVKDSTLLSIMVLGLFETVTGYNQKSLEAWAAHINGAAALIKLRGNEQVHSPSGLRMFIQVSSSLLISCIQRELPLPDHIIELREEAAKYVDTDDPAWHVQGLVIKFVDFRAQMKDKIIHEPTDILEKALEIDGAFIDVFTNLPPAWKYLTICTDKDPSIVWNGQYHVYYDYWVAQIWNAMRTCRILLNEVIRDELLKGFSARPPLFLEPIHLAQYQVSTDILFTLRDDILASVAQHLGYEPARKSPRSSTPIYKEGSISGDSQQDFDGKAPSHQPISVSKPSTGPAVFTTFDMETPFLDDARFGSSNSPPARHPSNLKSVMEERHVRTSSSSSTSSPPKMGSSFQDSSSGSPPLKTPTSSRWEAESPQQLPMLRGSGGYFLLWPLYLVGAMDIATNDVRKWVCQCLRSIGGTMGIFQAIALAGFLERQEEMAAWARSSADNVDMGSTSAKQSAYETRRSIFEERGWKNGAGKTVG